MKPSDQVWCVANNLTVMPGTVVKTVDHYANAGEVCGAFLLLQHDLDTGLFAPDASNAVLFPASRVYQTKAAAVAHVNKTYRSLLQRSCLRDRIDDDFDE